MRHQVIALYAQADWWTDLCSRTSPGGSAHHPTSWADFQWPVDAWWLFVEDMKVREGAERDATAP